MEFAIVKCHGAKRIRTADPLNAIEVLYQLSYNPLKILNKMQATLLQ